MVPGEEWRTIGNCENLCFHSTSCIWLVSLIQAGGEDMVGTKDCIAHDKAASMSFICFLEIQETSRSLSPRKDVVAEFCKHCAFGT